jgi:hypothetical protein
MKRKFILLLAGLLVTLCLSFADDSSPVLGAIEFQNVPTPNVLSDYEQMSGLKLVVDSRAKTVTSLISFTNMTSLTKDETLKLIQHALITQAGIVITRLDDKRASVTFNDALPITR